MRAVCAALVPVSSALVILVFVTCIAAVIAQHLFEHADQWNFGTPRPCSLSPHNPSLTLLLQLLLLLLSPGLRASPQSIACRAALGNFGARLAGWLVAAAADADAPLSLFSFPLRPT
jgi:hypothetical protein